MNDNFFNTAVAALISAAAMGRSSPDPALAVATGEDNPAALAITAATDRCTVNHQPTDGVLSVHNFDDHIS